MFKKWTDSFAILFCVLMGNPRIITQREWYTLIQTFKIDFWGLHEPWGIDNVPVQAVHVSARSKRHELFLKHLTNINTNLSI